MGPMGHQSQYSVSWLHSHGYDGRIAGGEARSRGVMDERCTLGKIGRTRRFQGPLRLPPSGW